MDKSRILEMLRMGARDPFHAAKPRDIFGGNDAPAQAAPDYGPMAAASAESARLGKELGDAQIAESRRQYDNNMLVSKPVVDAQLGLMNQTRTQGDEDRTYNLSTFRPLEQRMVSDANRESSDARAEEAAATAMADVRTGQTQQANMMARQGLRYGYSPAKMAAMAGQMAGSNASAVAGAATGARNNQRNLGWARSMDAAGLGRNLTGASQGAYGITVNAGNAAMGNQMDPGGALMAGMNQGAATTMGGQSQRIQGLGAGLSAQQSGYNASMTNKDQGGGGMGALLGAGATLGAGYMQYAGASKLAAAAAVA